MNQHHFKILIASVSLLVVTWAWAAPESSTSDSLSTPEVKKEKKKSANKRLCKKVKPTGSHIATRVCLKQREWDAMAKGAQESLRQRTGGGTGSVSQ